MYKTAKGSIFKRSTCLILAFLFTAGQISAGQISSNPSADTLAPSLASDSSLNPGRSTSVKNDVAECAKPGAIGNGFPLQRLLAGGLPSDLGASVDPTNSRAKVRESLNIAIGLHLQNRNAIPPANAQKADKTLINMVDLLSNINTQLHLFNAVVEGPEDYLVGFYHVERTAAYTPTREYLLEARYVGLSVELINKLYAISPKRLAQYIYHECVPEKDVVELPAEEDEDPDLADISIDRRDHRTIYQELQAVIFGQDEVNGLKEDLRQFIGERLELPAMKAFIDHVKLASEGFDVESQAVVEKALALLKDDSGEEVLWSTTGEGFYILLPLLILNDNLMELSIKAIRELELRDGSGGQDIIRDFVDRSRSYYLQICGTERYVEMTEKMAAVIKEVYGGSDQVRLLCDIALALAKTGFEKEAKNLFGEVESAMSSVKARRYSFEQGQDNRIPKYNSYIDLLRAQAKAGFEGDAKATAQKALKDQDMIHPLLEGLDQSFADEINHGLALYKAETKKPDDAERTACLISDMHLAFDTFYSISMILREHGIVEYDDKLIKMMEACEARARGAISQASNSIAMVLARNGRYDEAVEYITKKSGPVVFKKVNTLCHIAEMLVRSGDQRGGLKVYEKAIELTANTEDMNKLRSALILFSSRARSGLDADNENLITYLKLDPTMAGLCLGERNLAVLRHKVTVDKEVLFRKSKTLMEIMLVNKKRIPHASADNLQKRGETNIDQIRDFHAHSNYSDGLLDPKDLVKLAASKGVTQFALTDHDSIGGLDEAIETARHFGVNLIPGIELTTKFGSKTLHILGYGFDLSQARQDRDFAEYLNRLKDIDHKWAWEICEKSQKDPMVVITPDGKEHRISVTKEEVEEKIRGTMPTVFAMGNIISEKLAQISRELVIPSRHAEYVFLKRLKPGSATELYKPAIEEKYKALLAKYHIKVPHEGFWQVERPKGQFMSTEEAVKTILRVGGIPVLAHPGEQKLTKEEIADIANTGIKGLEVYTYKHGPDQTQVYEEVAREHNLFTTSGTDYHDDVHKPGLILGRDIAGDVVNKGVSLKEFKEMGAKVFEPQIDNVIGIADAEIEYRAQFLRANLMRLFSDFPMRKFVLAIDSDIGKDQQAQIMPIYKAIEELASMKDGKGELMFPNLTIVRARGGVLLDEIKKQTENFEDVIAVVKQENLDQHKFDALKEKAWMSAIDDVNIGGFNYLPIFEAITIAVMAQREADPESIKQLFNSISGKIVDMDTLKEMLNKRIIYILPKTIPIDPNMLRDLYERVSIFYRFA